VRIEPEHVGEIVVKLREWGVPISAEIHQDLVAEFDVRSDLDENRVGKFSKKSLASKKSALAILPSTGTQRRNVYDFIKVHPGTFREHIANCLEISENSVRPRVAELLEGGWIVVGGRQTHRGQMVEKLYVNAQKET
jgi:hypothetical protein